MIETAQQRELAGAQIEGFRIALEVIDMGRVSPERIDTLKQLIATLEEEVARYDSMHTGPELHADSIDTSGLQVALAMVREFDKDKRAEFRLTLAWAIGVIDGILNDSIPANWDPQKQLALEAARNLALT